MTEFKTRMDSISRIELDENTRELLKTEPFPAEISIRARSYFPKEFKAEGFKGVVWYGLDELDGEVAIKFTVFDDYVERSYLEEAKRARALSGNKYFAELKDVGVCEIRLSDNNVYKFLVFVEQWINGDTLSHYLRNQRITTDFFITYVTCMCGVLGLLEEMKFRHDDLRPENVMIEMPLKGSVEKSANIRIIDTGSIKSLEQPTQKNKDDYLWFATHLVEIRNTLRRHKPLSFNVKRFLEEIDPLLDRMFEKDRSASLWAPAKVYSEFLSANTRSLTPKFNTAVNLYNPFDFIAAEHIHSDELLVNLFAETCPWFSEVIGPNPVLLTGPRGCGKSMAFRRISLKAILYKTIDEILNIQIAGFYVSCSSDLRNRLGWLKTENVAKRFKEDIVHYFNLLVTREVIYTMYLISKRDDRLTTFGFGDIEELNLYKYILKQLRIDRDDLLLLHGMNHMQHLTSVIEMEMEKCYKNMRCGLPLSEGTYTTYLSDLSHFLSKSIVFFKDRKIALLLDDFSIHRLPKSVQQILNSILWDRQGHYVSKISAEKYGAEGIDDLKATSEIGRELREFDCGRYYLDANYADSRRFAKDLLGNRLKLAGYKGTPDVLIGPSVYEYGGLGESLRIRSENSQRVDNQYHGLKTIADICSGDVSNLLEVYRRIFEFGRVNANTVDKIPEYIQHRAIQSVSRDLYEMIKNYVPCGPEMYDIITEFGTLSRRILRETPRQNRPDKNVPVQTTRIEVDHPPNHAIDELSFSVQELMDELIRRTIFIEMEPGRSRHKFTTTLRWQLRRIYCPVFGTSIYKNDAIKWKLDEFKNFLINPKNACESEFKRRSKNLNSLKMEQDSLFDD